jgi:1-aminocyclopropane-1-carboxylate deaminase/D-cysteine desulfhydrase-like pyridoxal-dependent ACC family enzyme
MRSTLAGIPTLLLAPLPTAVEPLLNLSAVLGGGPRLLVKRDDALGFAFGGNKVRKLALLGARAQSEGCDTLITAGGLQSNHARVTAQPPSSSECGPCSWSTRSRANRRHAEVPMRCSTACSAPK